MFQFTKRDNDGRLFNGDVLLGSSTTAAAIYGTGENTKLYTFDEDYMQTEPQAMSYCATTSAQH